jgi:hypothetical protein
MSTVVGMATAYDLTVGVKVNMDEAIYMISPVDSPLLGGVGADGLTNISSVPVDQIEFFWMDEEILTPRTTIKTTTTTTDAFIVVATGDRTKFSTGDLIRNGSGSEIFRVTGYGATADSLTVTKGYAGTSATVSAGDIIMGIGQALPEGSPPENARHRDRTSRSNFTQIFGPLQVSMSGTEQVVSKYGVANEFNKQMYNRLLELTIHREQSILYGRKTNSTTTRIRSTGGLDEWITTNVSTSTQLTVANVQGMQQLGWNRGAVGDRLVANPVSLSDLADVNNTDRVRTEFDDPRRGRQTVLSVWTEYGVTTLVRDRWVHQSDAFLIRRDAVIRRPLRPMQTERLAKVGDSDQVMVLAEEGYEVKGESHMGKWTSLGYTGGV